jgi:hypothetical protein
MRDEGDSEEGDDIKNLPRKGTPIKKSCTPFKVVKNTQTQVYKSLKAEVDPDDEGTMVP